MSWRNSCAVWYLSLLFCFGFWNSVALAQPEPDNPPDPFVDEEPPLDDDDLPLLDPTIVEETVTPAFEPVVGAGTVFGDVGNVFSAPGSGTYLDQNDITYQSYADIDRVLRKAPGVYIRSEDGYGNFPNISLRGVDTTRSAKVTIMEDGVLTAPAPYAAPSAYYFPNVARMNAVEVIKGHSQIMYGPHTTGGAINFVSTPIPEEPTIYARAFFGSYNEYRLHTWLGTTRHLENGARYGLLVEGYLRETDGFKFIDQTPDFRAPDSFDTGFSRREPMIKAFIEPATDIYTRIDAKYGYTDFDANETYLGLSENDFAANALRRYAGSRFDNIDTHQNRSYLRYTMGDLDCDCWSLTATAYYNEFARNWFKLHDLRNVDTDGNGMPNPGANIGLSQALAGGAPAMGGMAGQGLEVLRGMRAGDLRVRNNNRSYYSYGYEALLSAYFEGPYLEHNFKIGFRYHKDAIRRFQRDELFTQNTNGTISMQDGGVPGDAGNRKQKVEAYAFWVQDAIKHGKLTITPGLRLEHLNTFAFDFNDPMDARNGGNDLDLEGGGVGVTYEISDQLVLLGGFHRGFSPPSPRGINSGLKEELSYASEGGFRYVNQERAIAMQAIGFYTHFDNLLVIDNIGGTGTGADENIGQVYAGGLEFTLEYDLGIDRGWCFRNPWWVVGTWTDARILGNSSSADEESLFAGAFPGARIPYIPEWAITFGSGLHWDLFGFDVTCIYADRTFTTASNVFTQTNPNGEPDSRFGTTDSYFLVDMSTYVYLTDDWKLFGGVHNVGDVRYVASRHPHGPRPGAPLIGYLGLEAIY